MLDLNIKNDIIHSLTIKERLNVFKKNNHIFENDLKNIKTWKKENRLINDMSFLKMLENENVSATEFNYAIKELNDADRSELYEELKSTELYSTFLNIIEVFKIEEEEFSKCNMVFDLSYTIRPFIFYLVDNISYFSIALRNVEICKKTMDELINSLANKLLKCSEKSVIHEFYECEEKDELNEKNSKDKFTEFIKKTFSNLDCIMNFYSKYATLCRLLTLKTSDFVDNIKEALIRLDSNLIDIEKEFNIKIKSRVIQEIKCGNGSQINGKSVLSFTFSDGSKIIYKPGDFSVFSKYIKFIEWFNENSNLLDIHVNKILDKGDYIFSNFVYHKSCTKESEVVNFYKRYGEIVSIMYFLCGSDLHLENIIASGEYPCIIDVETLIQSVNKLNFENKANMEAKKYIANSVFFSALLPFKVYGSDHINEVDISALSGYEEVIPNKVTPFGNTDKEELQYEHENFLVNKNNIPTLNGKCVSYKDYTKYIIEAFRETCSFIMKSKDFLVSDGFIDIFKDTKVRNILRSSYHYGILLDCSYNPQFTSDFLKREKLMENLWAYPYEDKRVIKYEVKDMLFDYIPMFYSFCDSKNLLTNSGVVINDYFDESGLDRVKNRINNITESEIEKQISYMIVSFGLYNDKIKENMQKRDLLKKAITIKKNNCYNHLEESLNIAEHIKNSVIYSKSKKSVTWVDIILNANNEWEVAPLESSAFQGLSGIAVYFFQLYKTTEKYYSFYKKILKSSYKKAGLIDGKNAYFNSEYSLMYPLLLEYNHTKDAEIIRKIDRMYNSALKKFKDNILDNEINYIRGMSKLIEIILSYFDVLKDEKYLYLADLIGKNMLHLIETNGIEDIKSGMGFGASGISLLLFKLWSYLKISVYKDKAIMLINHDRKSINFNDKSWATGSAGFGMSRLEINKYYSDELMQHEIKKCVNIAIECEELDDSLLNGNLGSIDFLINYYLENKDEYILKIVREKINHIISIKNAIGSYGIRSISGFETLNIYTGISGVGYELLRSSNPDKIPSVLKVSY